MRGARASIDSFLRQRRECVIRADVAECPSSEIFNDRCHAKKKRITQNFLKIVIIINFNFEKILTRFLLDKKSNIYLISNTF